MSIAISQMQVKFDTRNPLCRFSRKLLMFYSHVSRARLFALSGKVSRYKGGRKILGRLLAGVSVSLISTASLRLLRSPHRSVSNTYHPLPPRLQWSFPLYLLTEKSLSHFLRESERERARPLVFSFYSSAVLLLPPETSRSRIDRRPFSVWYKNMDE